MARKDDMESGQQPHNGEAGPTGVTLNVEYTYNGKRYRISANVAHHPIKSGPDVICFDPDLAERIRKLIGARPRKPQQGDGSDWIPKQMKHQPLESTTELLTGQHTPICWHEADCTFWCI